MGGALDKPGNITPLAEFNIYADAVAAARVFALTSPIPDSTMPPTPPPINAGKQESRSLPKYPQLSQLGSSRLEIVLFPLDITEDHPILRHQYLKRVDELCNKGSPLAEWHAAIMATVVSRALLNTPTG